MLELWRAAGAAATATDDVESIARAIDHPTARVLVAVEGDSIVGSIIAGFDGWRGAMYRPAVHPRARRIGLARALVTAGEDHLRALGARRVLAIVLAEEAPARGFWEAVGYSHQPGVMRYTKTL